ncbi:MAG: RNA-binding protein [Ferruginibacter sp.]|nr:RNA-binding protein [Ferruginibacter sp.]
MNIYVGNLSWSMTDEDLTNLFTQYGSVTSGKILKDKMNGRSKGFGFVEMEDDEAARTAIANLNETEVMGRKLIVNESQPRPEGEFKKRSGGFGGGGGFKKGGYGGGGNRGGYGGGNRGGYGGGGRDY